ncbi:MAG: hypothetical protein JRN15_06320 [Nitrososphaerota archaeon]|nr:hypothetical protein [Nitrososphaerota archaeon]
MSSSLALAQIPIFVVDLACIISVVISGIFLYRQATESHSQLKKLLLLVHFLFGNVVILNTVKDVALTPLLLGIYTEGGTISLFLSAELLTIFACLVYLQPIKDDIKSFLIAIFKGRNGVLGIAFVAFTLVVSAAGIDLVLSSPYSIQTVRYPWGYQIPSPILGGAFLLLTLALLLLFIAFPAALFFLARRNTRDRNAKKALTLMPILWSMIGAELLVVNGFLLAKGVDIVSFGYLFATLCFGVSAVSYKRAFLLTSFFESTPAQVASPSFSFSKALGLPSSLRAGEYLFEVDPFLTYEKSVKDLAVELLSKRFLAYVLTPKGSRVYNTLLTQSGLKFYVMTSAISYPRGSDRPSEMLVPENDPTIILDTLHKLLESVPPETGVGIVYDNISDMMISVGVETTYKFLKRIKEILADRNIVAIFLITHGAHEEKQFSLIQNVFANYLTFDVDGLNAMRISHHEVRAKGDMTPTFSEEFVRISQAKKRQD